MKTVTLADVVRGSARDRRTAEAPGWDRGARRFSAASCASMLTRVSVTSCSFGCRGDLIKDYLIK
jgi:hypothetical protein